MTLKELRALERRIHAESERKKWNNEYPVNSAGVQVIPALSEADKPDYVSHDDWAEFMAWRQQ